MLWWIRDGPDILKTLESRRGGQKVCRFEARRQGRLATGTESDPQGAHTEGSHLYGIQVRPDLTLQPHVTWPACSYSFLLQSRKKERMDGWGPSGLSTPQRLSEFGKAYHLQWEVTHYLEYGESSTTSLPTKYS